MIEPTDEDNLTARDVVDAAFAVHSVLGPGLLEFAYEQCLAHEMERRGISFERQVAVPFFYCGKRLDGAYRMDLLVDGRIVVEVKATDLTLPIHQAQVLTYLKLSGRRLGLLINFNVPLIRDGIRRLVRSR